MSTPSDVTVPAARRVRKSIATHIDYKKSMDKENATIDVTSRGSPQASRNKSRSKSIGPGGLDALRQSSGNRRASLAAPRSILKPRISALPEIPPQQPKKLVLGSTHDSLADKTTSSPFVNDPTNSKIARRTEEEQEASAREKEERDRRDARRKLLASRRVSFAAEATLHTFHEIEYMQDSTTSTDSTRRASSISGSSLAAEQGNTPQTEGAGATPAPSNHIKRRKSSTIGSPGFQDDNDTITSTIYSSDSEPADDVEEVVEDEEEASNSDLDDGTMMTIDTEDITGTTVGSNHSIVSAEGSSTLEEALRIAAERANTRTLQHDQENNELDDGEEIIPAFGWVKKPALQETQNPEIIDREPTTVLEQRNKNTNGTELDMDMDITSAMGRILDSNGPIETALDEDMSMEVTTAFGGILTCQTASSNPLADDQSEVGEATMEFTTALGGVHQVEDDITESGNNEDMSMEFTTILGGLLPQQKRKSVQQARRHTLNKLSDGEATMDMTLGVGQILSTPDIDIYEERDENTNTVMDMTVALGGILPKSPRKRQSPMKISVGHEASLPTSPQTATTDATSKGSSKPLVSQPPAAISSPFTSPGLLPFRDKPARRSAASSLSSGKLKAISRTPSPAKLSTPPRNPTTSPSIKPPRKSRSPLVRTTSSSRQVEKETAPACDKSSQEKTPQRRLSGIGADQDGLGSPFVTDVIDRRASIGDAALEFIPGKRNVSFDDPKELAAELEQERMEEARKLETFRQQNNILQEDKEATLNLMDMIDSLSPKRQPLHGRKSLHVGSAKGLLGKRPQELDDEDDLEATDGIKRLRGHQGSPVKNIRLQKPSSNIERAGKLHVFGQAGLESKTLNPTSSFSSPIRHDSGSSLVSQAHHTIHDVNLGRSLTSPDENVSATAETNIHLQEFLDMTSIRFMELNTTKRRHTVAPNVFKDGDSAYKIDDMSLERCVVASACTVPKLELYQHSCRELKKYISEGRRMVKEIESDTFEDNPPLFREYMSASSDVKALMDNQFKNVKTHARLLSKAMWYEWRMKLQEGLKAGLIKISEDMHGDHEALKKQEDLLNGSLPQLISCQDALISEKDLLEATALEIADCDPIELERARDEFTALEDDIENKKRQLQTLRLELEEAETKADSLTSKKSSCLAEIAKSEKVREDCRGWSSHEIDAMKARVEAIEQECGWAVTGISGSVLSMSYRRDIELVFDVESFKPNMPNRQIDLWYIADSRTSKPAPATLEKAFFVQGIRDHVRSLNQSQTMLRTLLEIVQLAWDKALLTTSEIGQIHTTFPTTVMKTSDDTIEVKSRLLLVPLETRVDIIFSLQTYTGKETGVAVSLGSSAVVLYGEPFNVKKIGEFLKSRIGDCVEDKEEHWSDVLVELHAKLIARGRK